MTRTEFYAQVNRVSEITLSKLISLANNNVETLLAWLNCDEAFGSGGVQICLHQDVVDGSDPSFHDGAIWDGTLNVENNAFYWCGADGPGGGRKAVKTRVYRHSLFDVT